MSTLPFTDREVQVGQLVAEGLTGPEIADSMEISEKTVRNYVYRMARLIPGKAPPMRRIARHFRDVNGTGEEVTG